MARWGASCRVPGVSQTDQAMPGRKVRYSLSSSGGSQQGGKGHSGRAVSLVLLCFPSETRCTTSGATGRPKEQAMDLQRKILCRAASPRGRSGPHPLTPVPQVSLCPGLSCPQKLSALLPRNQHLCFSVNHGTLRGTPPGFMGPAAMVDYCCCEIYVT